MANFTPGPWKTLAGDWDKEIDGYCRYTIEPLRELNAADARLIAAAPDGYALAEEIVNHLYTKQDIDRVRAMAKEFLAKAVQP